LAGREARLGAAAFTGAGAWGAAFFATFGAGRAVDFSATLFSATLFRATFFRATFLRAGAAFLAAGRGRALALALAAFRAAGRALAAFFAFRAAEAGRRAEAEALRAAFLADEPAFLTAPLEDLAAFFLAMALPFGSLTVGAK
jgi:hypothetical protein